MYLTIRTAIVLFSVSIIACLASFSLFVRYLNSEGQMSALKKSLLEDGLPILAISDDINDKCTGINATRFKSKSRASSKYKNSNTLPQWMKEYFDWHRKQTRRLNECNYEKYKFIFLRCSNGDRKCGGVADRLKTLPFVIAAAAKSKRIFMIRWERPTKLEEFLVPNEINWSVPQFLYNKTDSFKDTKFIPTARKVVPSIKRYRKKLVIEILMQDYYGGSRYYEELDCELDNKKQFDAELAAKLQDFLGWSSYELIYRDLFKTLFRPSPPIKRLVNDKMRSANLKPGEYSTSQYRAFYAVENQKHTRNEVDMISKTKNSINCASKIYPGAPVFFASDSHVAMIYARKYAEAFNRDVVTFDDEKEALHLDKKEQWKSGNVSDFYPTFVDLLIMAEARCMSHGVGGFGVFANILSKDPSCVIRHESSRKKRFNKCRYHNKGDVVASSDGSPQVKFNY